MSSTRDQLIVEARERGRRWGRYRYVSFGGFVKHGFPPMIDRVTREEAHKAVADILPLDPLGEALVLACYEAARDEFNAHVKEGKAAARGG